MASVASCWWACASATTFSAYDVVLRPAIALCSLRGHGTVTTDVVAGEGPIGTATTTSVGA